MDDNIQRIKNEEIDLGAIFQIFWSDRNLIIKITGAIIFLGILYSLLVTPLYKSTITMYPAGESAGGLNQFQGMASMFGMNMPSGESGISITDIINSRTLQTKIIYNKWNTNLFASPVNLISLWKINEDRKFSFNPLTWFSKPEGNMNSKLKWESSALGRLSDRISVNEKNNGLISISVLMEEPKISAQIANFIYEAVVELTNISHLKSAKLNRSFIQDRQVEINEVLILAENRLKEFRSNNRKVIDSPQLQLELERLFRDVEIQTQIFITLQQQYELARIEEVKETPSVIVLDKAFPSIYRHAPKRKKIVLISGFLGLFSGLFTSLLLSSFNKNTYKVLK